MDSNFLVNKQFFSDLHLLAFKRVAPCKRFPYRRGFFLIFLVNGKIIEENENRVFSVRVNIIRRNPPGN